LTTEANQAAAAAAQTDAAKAAAVTPEAQAAAAEAARAQAADVAAAEIARAGEAAAAAAAAAAAKADETVQYEYSPTGDPGLDVALGFIGRLGLSAETDEVQSAMRGDFAPIKAKLAAMGSKAKGFESHVALAEAAFTARTNAAKAKVARDEEAVYLAVGGKEMWDKVAAYAKANADEGEKAHIEAAMKAGGMQAQGVATLLLKAYQRAHPSTPRIAKEGASGAGGVSSGNMTAREYAAKVKELRGKISGPMDTNPAYLALRQQFAKSQK